jgi:ribonuclease D
MLTAGSVVRVQVIDTAEAFAQACDTLRAGTGPLAVDAERASGFTYSQRAYLIQIHRRGSGTFLFDPPPIGDMSILTDLAGDEEWVIHAASQDLPCLREVGIAPRALFDTELAARLLGFEKVGLGAVVEQLLDIHLAKEHSAVDWSTRPLPEPWLEYAALDVELLVDVRDKLLGLLDEAGKFSIAKEEFDAALAKPGKESLAEPWRRLSGLHTLRTPRQVAVARELWMTRDRIAAQRDVAPGRLVPDSSLVAAVTAEPSNKSDLAKLRAFNGRASRSLLDEWWSAIDRGRRTEELPVVRVKSTEPPPPRSWPDRNPEANRRLTVVRPRIAELSESLNIPLENLLTPSLLRSLAWAPPDALTVDSVSSALAQGGARAWQIAACAELICDSFVDAESIVDDADVDLTEEEPAPGVAEGSSSLANNGDST